MDIVERLRDGGETCGMDHCTVREASKGCVCAMAADEIERLRENMIYKDAELAQLRCALRVIATGEGVYGTQAREYKRIARAALGEGKPLEDRWDD